ncbi:hypothetical protein D9757_002112 [Collybiopsis confluens]|uniref:Uncharacterized protein n=1 Tax=Collybiopsis confluens TaxID=2823264 RepID=A0A8H5I051_9AGAR|nr:hypothetical protein D9757_002112 [Collybiopsis confluens]
MVSSHILGHHRIRAGFYKDLFVGEFAEGMGKRQPRANAAKVDEQVLDIVLHDRNISRAAFELSISRLYGGGPPLYIHPSLIPDTVHPLTTGFPYPPIASLSTSFMSPPAHQPGTPEFLVSLLATAIYFSIPSLASEALTAILRTIGPRTVGYYLGFSLGKTTVSNLGCPAVSLQELAIDLEEQDYHSTSQSQHEESSDALAESCSHDSISCASDESFVISSSSPISKASPFDHLAPFHYGPISDKIGEACSCWLERWGVDIFIEEEKSVLDWLSDAASSLDTFEASSEEEKPLTETASTRPRADSLPSGLRPPSSSTWSPNWTRSKTRLIPRLFTATAAERSEGLSLDWILALISSNGFFVSSPSLYHSFPVTSVHSPAPEADAASSLAPASIIPEEERYEFAKRVVELRRAVRSKVKILRRRLMAEENLRHLSSPTKGEGKESPTAIEDSWESFTSDEWDQWCKDWDRESKHEDEQWGVFFRTHIYYVNMSSETIMRISDDHSPSSGQTYVDLPTLQQAFWDHGMMKMTITGGAAKSNSLPPEKLGFMKRVSNIIPTSLLDATPYFLVPADESLRVGDTITHSSAEGNIHNNISMDELFESSFGERYLNRGGERESALGRSGALGQALPGKRSQKLIPDKTLSRTKTPNESTFFGLLSDVYFAIQTDDANVSYCSSSIFKPTALGSPRAFFPLSLPPTQRLHTKPPLRFSVEFFDLDMLKEKERYHSRTVWYAGSLWNVYVQIVKKKKENPNFIGASPEVPKSKTSGPSSNYQLGVYLHRHSPSETLPPFSAPDPFAMERRLQSKSATREIPLPNAGITPPSLAVPRPQYDLAPGQSSRLHPLTPSTSAPQVASSSITALRSPPTMSSNSRFRGNSTSIPVATSSSSSLHPLTTPGSTTLTPSIRPRTPGGSGGWRNLGSSNTNSPVNATSGGGGFLSSSLPTVFPTFGRTRHPSSSPRDGNRRIIGYGISGASSSSVVVGSPSSPSSFTSSPSSPIPTTPIELSPAPFSSKKIPDPPFHAIMAHSDITYPYLDPRPVVSVYFSVNCLSPTGNAQTRFRSAPDAFKLDGSWGWKSSGLLDGPRISDMYGDIEAALIQMQNEMSPVGQSGSLRANVVLGVV